VADTCDMPHFDVILIQPNITWAYDPFEHLGLAYLAASLRQAAFTVKIIDAVLMRQSHEELCNELDAYQIGVLGVTLVSHGYLSVVKLMEAVKRRHPTTKIVAGGHFATFAAQKIMDHTTVFDAIVLGEGEITFTDLCRAWIRDEPIELTDVQLPGGRVRRSAARINHMDDLPLPARDQLRFALSQGAAASVTSSRGCYARCSFCTVHSFYKLNGRPQWRARSIPNVIEELRYLHREFDIDHFMFIDDNFIGPGEAGRQRAMDFATAYHASGLPMSFHIDCRAVDVREDIVRALQRAGLRSIFVGIESIAMNDLRLYRKGLKTSANWAAAKFIIESGLDYTFSMIMFNPTTTADDILANIEFLKTFEYYPRNPLMILNLYEGTDLNKQLSPHIHGPFWDYRFRFSHERTAAIYQESMAFCKSTLSLERELSLDPIGTRRRREVHRLRLLNLEDVARRLGTVSATVLRDHWDRQLAALIGTLPVDEPNAVTRAGVERSYLTGSPMDAATVVRGHARL
jgi:radical SAM superfamily enzyme YgiQ (UPF0313 family)